MRAELFGGTGPRGQVTQLGFLLLPEFPLYALVPAIEALRIANQNSDRKLFDWKLISVTGAAVEAGNGLSLSVDCGIEDMAFCPAVFVLAGNHPKDHLDRRLLNWLRRQARHGGVLGAIDNGAFALAEAGLLKGHQVTLHWESVATFRDHYPDIDVTEQLFIWDRDRITCAGGNATLDLMLQLIAKAEGPALAQIIANAFVAEAPRAGATSQRNEAERIRRAEETPVGRVLHDMETHIAEPLSAQILARRAGLSTRALSRVLRDKIGDPPMRYYRKMRLQNARNALFYSDQPVQDVAIACGFASPEAFSRAFKENFGVSPREFRRRYASEALKRFRPELALELRPQEAGGTPDAIGQGSGLAGPAFLTDG